MTDKPAPAGGIYQTIELTRADFDTLMLMAGMATGAAMKIRNTKLAESYLRLVNKINKDNPNWIPYTVQPE